jgi:hypothetical protein
MTYSANDCPRIGTVPVCGYLDAVKGPKDLHRYDVRCEEWLGCTAAVVCAVSGKINIRRRTAESFARCG